MAMDAFDWVAVLGFGGVIVLTTMVDPEPILLSALLGGFVLSLAVWRFYQGLVWEALGWLVWVGAAVIVGLGIEGETLLQVLFTSSIFLGLLLLLGGRLGLLPNVWAAD